MVKVYKHKFKISVWSNKWLLRYSTFNIFRWVANMQRVKKSLLADIWRLHFALEMRNSLQIQTVRKVLNSQQISKNALFYYELNNLH
jgi:hypothetical protein